MVKQPNANSLAVQQRFRSAQSCLPPRRIVPLFCFSVSIAAEIVTKFTSNILPTRSHWTAIVGLRRYSCGCSATPGAWSITRALRLTIGLTSILFGTRLRRVKTLLGFEGLQSLYACSDVTRSHLLNHLGLFDA